MSGQAGSVLIAVLMVFLAGTVTAAQSVSFSHTGTLGVGVQPTAIATADFNGDGKPDLVVTTQCGTDPNCQQGNVSVLLGKGDGTFQPAVDYPAGFYPFGVAVGDFNHDTKPDFAVTNFGDNTVGIYLNNGDGTFQAPITFETGTIPWSASVGDFNHDGNLDLVVADYGNFSVGIFLGNGDGTFRNAGTFHARYYLQYVAVGDFNGDGNLDLAAVNTESPDHHSGTVSILLGNGDGTFAPEVEYDTGQYSTWAAVKDVNGDGYADLLVSNAGDGTVSVLLGNGDGTFRPPVNYTTGSYSYSVALGDFDGDGKVDLAVPNFDDNNVSVLLGNSDGTFQTAVNIGAGAGALMVAVADFDGDGKPDVAVANDSEPTVWILRNTTGLSDKGVITSPVPGSTLAGSTVPFVWTAGISATAYMLDAGATPGGHEYFQSGNLGNVLTVTASGLPVDGSTVYVTLWSLVNGNWVSNQYTYTAFNLQAAKAVLTTPPPGSTFISNTVTFGWTAGMGASAYMLDAGATPGGHEYFQSGNLGNALTVTAGGLPVDGSTVYVTLWSMVNGTWVNNQYTYTAFTQVTQGVMTSPAPGSTFPGTTVTFVWTRGTRSTAYRLDIGKTPGGRQYYSANEGNLNTVTVNNLPSDGSTVYVTLYSLVQGHWLSNSYTYTAWNASSGQAVLTTPPPGSQFNGVTVTFGWTAGTGANGYRIDVGSTPGSHDYYSSHVLNNLNVTVSNLPTDGSVVYVTLYTRINGTWYSTMYQYTAWNVALAEAQMLTPPPGSQFDDPTVTFIWTSGTGATAYRLDVGKTPGGHQYYQSGVLNVLTETVANLPTDGSTVYVTLYTQLSGKWYSVSYTYKAFKPKAVKFSAAVNYAAGNLAHGIAAGDFNYDGYLDLAVGNAEDNTVGIMLGKGDGTFKPAVTYGVGNYPWSLVVGDFDRDGKLDLATANQTGNNTTVLLGYGNGTFRPAVNYSAGNDPWDVSAGDFNGDGILDLAVVNQNSNNVSVLLGNGDGTFRTAVNYAVGQVPWSVNVGDFDGDGAVDIVVADDISNDVSVLLGNGDGTFRAAVKYRVIGSPSWVGVADLNGDGKPDLVVTNQGTANVSVLLNNGDGTFAKPVNYNTGNGARCVVFADFNGDGKLDAAVSNRDANSLSILIGNGNGTFQPALNMALGRTPYMLVVGDFNGDGKPDLAIATDPNTGKGTVSVLLNLTP